MATLKVTVKEKIDKLGERESNPRLRVEAIDLGENSVKIIYNFCNETSPYSHSAEAALHIGDHVSINSVNAILLGIEGAKATFKFEANGGEFPETCLI